MHAYRHHTAAMVLCQRLSFDEKDTDDFNLDNG
jgi:hypothetical protein